MGIIPIVLNKYEVKKICMIKVKGVTICSIWAKKAVRSQGSLDQSWIIVNEIIQAIVESPVHNNMYKAINLTGKFFKVFLKASKLEPPIISLSFISLSEVLDEVRLLDRRIATKRHKIEKTIKEIGPKSDIELLPHISVEKYLAAVEPKKAPNDPPALITPNTRLASEVLK